MLPILDELRPVFEVCTPSAEGWTRARLPGLPEIGVVDVWRLDAEEAESNGDLLANIQDPLTPSSLMLIEGVASPAVLKRAPRTFSADGLVVTQHEAVSVDGERIPYVQTGPATLTGDAPVHINAYGGFGIAVRPNYNSAIGKLWLERGGTSVQLPISAAAANSARAGTMPAAMPASGSRMMILPPSPPTSSAAASPGRTGSPRKADRTAAS